MTADVPSQSEPNEEVYPLLSVNLFLDLEFLLAASHRTDQNSTFIKVFYYKHCVKLK